MEMRQPYEGASFPTPTPDGPCLTRNTKGQRQTEKEAAWKAVVRAAAKALKRCKHGAKCDKPSCVFDDLEGAKTIKELLANLKAFKSPQRGQEVAAVCLVARGKDGTPGEVKKTPMMCRYDLKCGNPYCGYQHSAGATAQVRWTNRRKYRKAKKAERQAKTSKPAETRS